MVTRFLRLVVRVPDTCVFPSMLPLYAIAAEHMLNHSRAAWLDLPGKADIPCGPMNTPDDLSQDRHFQAVEMFPVIQHPNEGS